MIVYIFLKRTCGLDIVSSFQSQKCKKMLKGINLLEYSFQEGHLVYKSMVGKEVKKVSDPTHLTNFLDRSLTFDQSFSRNCGG